MNEKLTSEDSEVDLIAIAIFSETSIAILERSKHYEK